MQKPASIPEVAPEAEGPVRFPEDLPISAHVVDIARAVQANPVVIVAGETGSGKTTQLPKICLAMGRGLEKHIGVTQPRRIAATSVASRVARELGVELGKEVGYKIRFSDRTSPSTYVKFMTDGILLAEMIGDPLLRRYDTIILDEAHERSLNIDFLLGYVKRILPKRPDLRVIISSATLETERFSAFFDRAPVIQVSGRTYPVEVFYRPPRDTSEGELSTLVANVVDEISELDPREDILVFLPGEREIHEALDELQSRALPHTTILPLYGRLPPSDQQRVFQTLPERRVVLSTNVAETSLTIPGIVYVVDAGLARINRYHARSGVTALQIEPISRASADQRKGRAGRVRPGVCFRLYDEKDFEGRPAYTDPEVLRVGLSGVILQMKSMGLGRVEDFPFLDPPPKRAVDEGYRVLEELSALDAAGELSDIGKKLARLPLDPRIGRMILGGEQEGALREVLVIAAVLSAQDPRERPLAAQKQADDAHRKFRDENSDFLGLLKIWHAYQDAQEKRTKNQLRKFCHDHFLSWLRLREWSDVHRELSGLARDMGFKPNDTHAKDEAIHKALLPGLLSRIGTWHPEQRIYLGARQTRFAIHPSSALAKKPPTWVMAAELVETSQLFARAVARIDPAWLEEAAGHLCRRSHGDPHWEQRPAQVMAKEQVTLYGLPVVRERRVHYGPIDPAASRRLFIIHALVRQEYVTKGRFMEHNKKVFEEVGRLRDKARKSDMLADEHALALFFEARVPDEVHSGKTFEEWRKKAEHENPHVLELSPSDVLLDEALELTPERYPDTLSLYGTSLPLSYRFDPGEDDDGVTVTLPLVLLPQADPAVLAWTLPGWHTEKIHALLDSLPKATRKSLGALKELAGVLSKNLRPFEGPMFPALTNAISELTGVRVPQDAWNPDDLLPHLHFYFRIVDEQGKTLGEGRDLAELKERLGSRARAVWAGTAKTGREREGLSGWTFDELPERVPLSVGGRDVFAYPALVDMETSVALRMMESPEAAAEATRAGLRRLFLLGAGTTLVKIEQQLSASLAAGTLSNWTSAGGVHPRRQIAMRALDEAFGLEDPGSYPRKKAAFTERLLAGQKALPAALQRLGGLSREIAGELDRAQAALKALAGKPGAPRASLEDVRGQLERLLFPGLFLRTPLSRLAHLPRYLRAIQVRLERMPNGPQKDQAKAAQVLPFWSDWLKHGDGLRSRGVPEEDLAAYRWLIEEMRVSLFAPELKTAVPVSQQRLTEQWKALVKEAGL